MTSSGCVISDTSLTKISTIFGRGESYKYTPLCVLLILHVLLMRCRCLSSPGGNQFKPNSTPVIAHSISSNRATISHVKFIAVRREYLFNIPPHGKGVQLSVVIMICLILSIFKQNTKHLVTKSANEISRALRRNYFPLTTSLIYGEFK